MPRQEWSFLMKAEDHREVKWVVAWLQAKLTPLGQIIFGMIVVGLAISSVGTQISAYFLVSLIVALFLTSWVLASFIHPKVEVTRILPHELTCGGECELTIVLKNVSNTVLRNVEVFDQQLPVGIYSANQAFSSDQILDWLPPGQSTSYRLRLRIPRRGAFELQPVLVATSFPTGLFRSLRKSGRRDLLVVYPQIIKWPQQLRPFSVQFQPGGLSFSSRRGQSNEFLSTREYREGDRMRDIDWKASARNARLIVKEYIEEYAIRVGIVLDVELKRFEKHRCFEKLISLCAGLLQDFCEKKYLIDVYLNDPHHVFIELGPGKDSFSHGLEMLSAIEGETVIDFQPIEQRLKERMTEYSAFFLLLKDWDMKRKKITDFIRTANGDCQVVVVRDQNLSLRAEPGEVKVYTSRDI